MTAGVVLALCSALVWGSGDFCGGRAARRMDPFQVLALAAVSGIALLGAAAVIASEPLSFDRSLLWGITGGVAGACGIVALYRGLAIGSAATVAPLAAVMAAVLPVVFAIVVHGRPRTAQLAGFVLALAGIWLVARASPRGGESQRGARLGLLAGVGFGGFLILLAQVQAGAVYTPVAVARLVMLAVALITLSARRMPFPGVRSNPIALLAGVLDAGGNVLYLLAAQRVRLDIAAVLSSLYPVATVLLARTVTGEAVTRMQWVGAAVCFASVVLITA
jgi:drug/metabolite transporter (DMT)-like permease